MIRRVLASVAAFVIPISVPFVALVFLVGWGPAIRSVVASVPDPIVPTDGTQGVTGGLDVSGSVIVGGAFDFNGASANFNGDGFTGLVRFAAVLDVASIAAETCRTDLLETAANLGTDDGDACFGPNVAVGGVIQRIYLDDSPAGDVILQSCNVTTGAVDPASQTYRGWCLLD